MYTSQIINLPRNNEKEIILPFEASYIRIDILRPDGDRGPIFITLDDGEDIPFLARSLQIDYNFSKFKIKIGNWNAENIEMYYFISSKKDEVKETIKEELTSKVEDLINENNQEETI